MAFGAMWWNGSSSGNEKGRPGRPQRDNQNLDRSAANVNMSAEEPPQRDAQHRDGDL